MPRSEQEWTYYQAGPSSNPDTIVFLHGTSGTAASFFYQVQALGEKGYRAVSAQYPAYDSPADWCKGFDLFLDSKRCRSVHLFGAGLGGFLAQHFSARFPQRVRSLVLCNSFCTTRFFAERAGALSSVVSLTPTPLLRQAVLESFPQSRMTLSAKQAIDWVAQQMMEIPGNDLASRLLLNCTESCVGAVHVEPDRIMLLESSGETMVPDPVRAELRQRYPNARFAELKASGDFPYLSGAEETTLFVEVHMRRLGVSAGLTCCAGQPGARAPDERGGATAALPEPELAPSPKPRPVWRNPFEDDPIDPLL